MATKKEPPDKYRCLKLPITSILHNIEEVKENMEILQKAIIRTNAITTKTYFLLRLWVLHKYHNNQEIPEITEDTISMCMKSIMKSSSGQKPKGNNALLLEEFRIKEKDIIYSRQIKNCLQPIKKVSELQ